jgi:glycerol kinase
MAKHLILSIDQGTTGSTALFIDVSNPRQPRVLSKATVDYPQHFPAAGWVEHDLDEIWVSVCRSIEQALDAIGGKTVTADIKAIGISNQRETICVFDRKTSKPVSKAVVWQCRRSSDICANMKAEGLEPMIREKTGLVLDPYFSASKIYWLLTNNNQVRRLISDGSAVLGTIDCWLLHKLTNGKAHATESGNASRTMLFDIKNNTWDPELLKLFGNIPITALPEVKSSAGEFGVTKNVGPLPDGIPITAILGDQQAALAGQACFEIGEAKCTFGTGAFLLLNTGSNPVTAGKGILSTIAWNLEGKLSYALEGSSFIAGAAIQFIRDQFGFLTTAKESEELAQKGSAAPHLYFVPALAGLSAPWWNPKARGAFLGLHRGTTKNDLIRATLEGIALQVSDLTTAMESLIDSKLKILRVDGGASANNFLMQLQSDLLGTSVDRPYDIESTAIGAGLFAGLGVGIYESISELSAARNSDTIFHPSTLQSDKDRIHAIKAGWIRAVKAVQVFSGDA